MKGASRVERADCLRLTGRVEHHIADDGSATFSLWLWIIAVPHTIGNDVCGRRIANKCNTAALANGNAGLSEVV